MNKIFLLIFTVLLIFACSTDPNQITNVEEKPMTYCDVVIYQGGCWSLNVDTWNTIDLTGIIKKQSLIEIEIVHNGGETTETIACKFRKNSNYNECGNSATYTKRGIVIFTTDGNCCFEWCHAWGADETRKINLVLKLKMY